MEYLTHIILVSLVVVIVLFGTNIKNLVTIGLGLIVLGELWAESNSFSFSLEALSLESFGIIATLAAVLVVMIIDQEKDRKEALMLLAAIGLILVITAEDWITLYLALELQSLAFYTMAGYRREDQYSAEAGLKYFVLGALASGLYLLGASLNYGATGSLAAEAPGVLITIAILFKLGAAPFHMWLPDVYQGAPTASTAFFAITPKLSLLILLARLYGGELSMLIGLCALASMLVGALGALNQSSIKRLLAYSAIAHVGYVLLALGVNTSASLSAVLVYTVLYMITTSTIFALLVSLTKTSQSYYYLVGYSGLSRTNPVLAATMAVSLFALAGIPPLSGFLGKLLVFSSAVQAGQLFLPFIGLLTSVIAAFYYIRIIKIMYFKDSANFHSAVLIQALTPQKEISFSLSLILGSTVFITLFFIAFPAPLYLVSSFGI